MVRSLLLLSLLNLQTAVRVKDPVCQQLREIKLSLSAEHGVAAPSVQDLVTVALLRLIADLEQGEKAIALLFCVTYPSSVRLRDFLLIKDFSKQRYQIFEPFVVTFLSFSCLSQFILTNNQAIAL